MRKKNLNISRQKSPDAYYSVKIWMGMEFHTLLKLHIRNYFKIHWSKIHFVILNLFFSAINSILRILKEVLYSKKIKKYSIKQDPIFIIGHWRTGTTLLHELLAMDSRHISPNYYQCFAPNHFLITEKIVPKLMNFTMPPVRPSDPMRINWNSPQEDEFALCNLGIPSPYLDFAYPNNPSQYESYLDLESISAAQLKKWKKAFLKFLKEVSFKNNKRLILKSPTHSCRIKILTELFPNAQFVHIVRNPYVVFPSTMHLWKILYRKEAYQVPNYRNLENKVLRTFPHLYQKIGEGRHLLSPKNYYELKYEDLVENPEKELKNLYAHLEISGFENFAPQIIRYFKERGDYRTNRFENSPETNKKIEKYCLPVLEKYNYKLSSIFLN